MYYGNFTIGNSKWRLMEPWKNANKRKLIGELCSYIRNSTPTGDQASWKVWNDDGELCAKGHFSRGGRFSQDPF